jgi:hypothetical protein
LIVDGSKSLIIKSFNDYYYFDKINKYLNAFKSLIKNDQNLLKKFKDLIYLNDKLCDYIDQNHFLIEQNIFNSLNIIHQQFFFFIQFLHQHISNKINSTLFMSNQQQFIHTAISFVSNLFIISIFIIIIIPLVFFISISTNYRSNHRNKR